jgi:hypothetical protein
VKITEQEFFRHSILTVIQSSATEDVSLLIKRIKTLKQQPFYSVFIFMPSILFQNNLKQFIDQSIKFKQAEIKNDLAKLEVA